MTTSAPDDRLDPALVARLAALETRAPAAPVTALPAERVRRRRAASLALAPVLVLAVAATAVAGGAIVRGLTAEGHPGVENPGQPLAGANLECMTPPQAEAYLAARGFRNVDWQVERGDVSAKTGTSTHQSTAPVHGYVVPGSILDDGSLIMVVDQRTGATGVGACAFESMP